jgi:photosystem II stability/assembly factor-like uncharacterized protein
MAKARLRVLTDQVEAPYGIEVAGSDWGSCPVLVRIDDETPPARLRVLLGEQHGDAVQPIEGRFSAVIDSPGLSPGKHTVIGTSTARKDPARAEDRFELLDVPDTDDDGRPNQRWLRRRLDFNLRRFPTGRAVPGARLRALEHRNTMRVKQGDRTAPPVDPGCNWYPLGPSVVRDGQVFAPAGFTTAPISGRVTDLAIDPNDVETIYAATAQGGLWKSTNGGQDWDPKSDFTVSLACGCVTIDPSVTDADGRSTRILAGTGEPNNSDSYYGAGMLLSTDGGETWVARGTTTFVRAAFDTIAVDPANSQHLIAATDQGVYESTDEGVNWTLADAGVAYDLVVDWAAAGGAEVYVARQGLGVRRRIGTGAWTTLGGGLPAVTGRFALAMAPSDPDTIYAAIPSGMTVTFYRTTDGGGSWSATAATVTGSQLNYNLILAVDPTDPDTLLFGEVDMWRSTNAGGSWTRVSAGSPGIHADQHALAYDPTDGNRVFAGNDGGAWLSTDGGVHWTHRNKDLATLQYFGTANHGTYEAIALGGTQDNGAQRYVGHPAWEHAALGDGAFCAIDKTSNSHRWYETRWYSFPCFRSDSSGAAGTFAAKQSGIVTNSNWFYPPFEMDPNDSTVLYCGYNRLFRTSNSADAWTAITGDLGSNITAIAIAPSNSGIAYVGLRNGRVYSVTGSGMSWTETDISAAPIPAGQVSDIAVHPTDPNTIYVTTSNLIFGEGAGESFTTDHVYRTTNGGTSWASVSTGLSAANPVNSIVIDPSNPQTVFIGADVGVFRSDNGGTMSWAAWDQGLPNCSVQHLDLFAPHRLLRAATHGRSVWERPIDAASCALTQLYVRDNILDTGRTTPSVSHVVHPFDDTKTEYWWHSADIKIDSPDPATNTYAFAGLDIDYLQFEGHAHDNPRRDTWVRAYVQTHVRGNEPATNVRVKAFWADASAALPPLPADFWTAFPNADPSNTAAWHPLGPAKTIQTIDPARPEVVGWSWHVSATAPTHTCLLAVVTSDEDPIAVATLDVGAAINGSNHVTLKNLHVDNVVPGATGADATAGPYMIEFAVSAERAAIDIRFNTRGLLPKSVLHVVLPKFESEGGRRRLLRGFKETERIPKKLRAFEQPGCGEPVEFDMERAFTLEVGEPGRAKDLLPGLYGVLPQAERFAAAITVTLPRKRFDEPLTFSIEQWTGGQPAGGSTYELRPVGPDVPQQ